MKRNKWLPMVLAVAAIAVLGGGYLTLERLNQVEEEVQTVEVATVSGEVDSIEYTTDTGKVTLVKSGDVWQWSEDAEFPLMQEYPQSMASQSHPIDAVALVRSDGDGLADYGLDSPSKTIVLKSGDESVTCLIGDLNNYTGEYYMMLDGSKEIYTVSSSFWDTFSYGLYDMIEKEMWPVTSVSNVTSVERENADGTVLSVTASDNEDGTLSYQVNGQTADHTAAEDYVRTITYLTVSECVNYKAGEEERSTYGLDAPAAVLRIGYTEGEGEEAEDLEITLTIGASNGEGGYYVCIDDSQAVNIMPSDLIEEILAAAEEDFAPKEEAESSSSESQTAESQSTSSEE